MEIDKLFKIPRLPAGSNKRKFPDNPSPEMLKKLKMEGTSTAVPLSHSSGAIGPTERKSNRATAEEADFDDEEVAFAPGGDADYFTEEDDEGRFFGGGLTSEQKEILNIFEKAEGDIMEEEGQEVTITQVRRLLQNFERAVNKNQDQRSKYPSDPSKFIDSEADLDSAIKALLPLSQSPTLAYPELARSGALEMLTGLLTHENMDIVIDVVELIYELTDEDADVEFEDEDYEQGQAALKVLITGLVANSTLELLVDNLVRLNEVEDTDKQGVFHILGIFENVVGIDPSLASELVPKTNVLIWLLNRIQSKTHNENRGYSAELLSILLQSSSTNKVFLGQNNGVEIILKVLSQYRRRDPVDAEETEFMENLFDALCSAMTEVSIKNLFLAAEGPDLMILMMKDKFESKSRSIKVLDYAMSGLDGALVCEAFVEALGIKTLFTTFMGKSLKHKKMGLEMSASEDIAHTLGIISSLLTNLPTDSSSRIRVLAKFAEGEYEKVDKLLELRDTAIKKLKILDAEIDKERKVMSDAAREADLSSDTEDVLYIRRLDGGLFTLQTVDYILAWIMMEDDGVRNHALRMLDRGNQSLENVLQTLRLYHEHIDEDPSTETSAIQKEILRSLISALHTAQPE